MARTVSTVEIQREVHRYFWPEPFLNLWLLVIIGTGITQIVVYALFIEVQNQFHVGVPWLFPFSITIGSLTLAFAVYIQVRANQRELVPAEMMVLATIFFGLYLAGLVECSIQLFGTGGNVNGNCRAYVYNQRYSGISIYTLAWLQDYMLCQGWYASFAFYIIGVIFCIWLFVMAFIVMQNQVDASQRFLEEE